jgi:hypothetical protein
VSRARGDLEQGEDSTKGASSPRARRRFTKGGVQPSSEVEISWCGVWPSSEAEIRPRRRPALERGGDSPKGASGPRARWRSRGAASGPRARRKFSRGAPRLDARWAAEVIWVVCSCLHQAMIMRGVIYGLWVCLCFIVLRKTGVFPLVTRGPSWLSLTVAPEPLRWCPLGTCRG